MNYSAIINSPKYTHWAVGAAECYKRGGVCNNCETFELIGKQCKMKAAVISLVKHCGPPPENIMEKEGYHHEVSAVQYDNEPKLNKENNMQEEKLTKKEAEIRDLLLQGLNYKQITEKLVVSMATLKSHVNSIFQKRDYHSLQDLLVGENKRQDKEIIEYVIAEKQKISKPKNNERIEKDMIKINTKKMFFDVDLNYSYGQSYIKIIDAIKKGYNTNNDIASVLGISGNLLSVKNRDFCRTLEDRNLLNSLDGKTYLQKIVSFVNKRMNKTEENPYIPAPGDIITEQINVPVKRKPDTISNEIEQLKTENEQLKARIQELENQPKTTIDFSAVKDNLTSQIAELNAKLQAIELLEKEFINI